MSDFMAKMYQIRFRLRLRPRPRWGAYSAPPDSLAGFKGPTSKGRGGKGRGGEGRGGERRTCLPPRFDNPGYGPGCAIEPSNNICLYLHVRWWPSESVNGGELSATTSSLSWMTETSANRGLSSWISSISRTTHRPTSRFPAELHTSPTYTAPRQMTIKI